MSNKTFFSGVVSACMPKTEQPVVGHREAWFQNAPRPRHDAFLILDPTQRPSAPLRWGT